MANLDEILERLRTMDEVQKDALKQAVIEHTGDKVWFPNPGPQLQAMDSQADVLLYGGQGGGGKTDLIAGLALTEHHRSLILRPQYTDVGAIIDRCTAIAKTKKGLNKSPPAQFKYDGRVLDFGGAKNMDQAETWQGNPHDLICFDEACLFIEDVVRFIMGWNRRAKEELDDDGIRSTVEILKYIAAQGRYPDGFDRSRTLMASNPPITASGDWIIPMFRPWLDVNLPKEQRAEYGELRWVVTDPDGKDVWVDGPTDIKVWDGKTYLPRSRTFIPAKLEDNPFLVNTGYQATLDAMPEPMRSAIRDGNFMAAREDDAFQVIPTSWVLEANDRWRQGRPKGAKMVAIGLDVARGGRDETVLAPRYGEWFEELIRVPGRETKRGPEVAALVAGVIRHGAVVGVDNIGIGADAETSLENAHLPVVACNGSEGATMHTRDGAFTFYNRRSEMWWMLREALDPDYGHGVALPPDSRLLADLTAPTYTIHPGTPPKIKVEGKDDMKKRLGRSPDCGDAVVYSWNVGGMFEQETGVNSTVLSTPQPTEAGYDPLRH